MCSVSLVHASDSISKLKEIHRVFIEDRLSCLPQSIPLHYNNHIQAFINYFTYKDRAYTERILTLQRLYFPIFEHILKSHHLPESLKYLAVVESGLRPHARSKAGAVGLWQFIPSTARLYGLKINKYVDERRDPYLSTDAACKFLKDLYQRFGNWELALAAFNSGPGRVSRAIYRSKSRSFWKMYRYLPRETRAYVPQFIAITYVMNYSMHHALFPKSIQFLPESDTVHLTQAADLAALAQALSVCKTDLLRLNPDYIWQYVPASTKAHILRLPVHAATSFRAHRSTYLTQIAEQTTQRRKYIEQRLRTHDTYGRHKTRYRVRRGDTLSAIALRYGVRVSDIKRWNHLRSSRIYAGKYLKLWIR